MFLFQGVKKHQVKWISGAVICIRRCGEKSLQVTKGLNKRRVQEFYYQLCTRLFMRTLSDVKCFCSQPDLTFKTKSKPSCEIGSQYEK